MAWCTWCDNWQVHRPLARYEEKNEYSMFSAAEHGCLACVEYYVTVVGVDPWVKCEEGHDGVYYAQKGGREGQHAVKNFLMQFPWSKWEDMSGSSEEEEEERSSEESAVLRQRPRLQARDCE